jgi:uncharacterized protein
MHEHDTPVDDEIRSVLAQARRIAVLGASARRDRASYRVPAYLARHGYEIVPVNPRYAGEELHGHVALSSLDEIDRPIDLVDVFRRATDVDAHVDEVLAMRPLPGAVWLQLGIRNDDAARAWRAHGITVIQDRCTLVEHRRAGLGTVGATRP